MGCTNSCGGGARGAPGLGVLVRSGKNLRKADDFSESDPFCVVRFGEAGSSWKDKGQALERRSTTAWDTANPLWQFAFSVQVPKLDEVANDWEMQLRVYDRDLLSEDDPLGELVVSLSTLKEHPDSFKDYPLGGPKAKPGSTVEIIAGERVEKQLYEELQKAVQEEKESVWCPRTKSILHQLGSYWNLSPTYALNMVMMGQVWAAAIEKGQDPASEWFTRRTKDSRTGVDTYKWSGPEYDNSMMLSGQADCVQKLSEFGGKYGTTDQNGTAFHPGYLGCNKMNPSAWPEVPWHTIGLGAPVEAHAKVRPLITKLTGPAGKWTLQWLSDEARMFFQGRTSIDVHKDTRTWVTRILHKVLTGITLTEREGDAFMDFQRRFLIFGGVPEGLADNMIVTSILKASETMEEKKQWIKKYEVALVQHLPECKEMSPTDLNMFASAVLDALVFAGGQSVPTVIQFALAIPFSKWGEDCLPKDFNICDVSKLPGYVWEIIRRFPPVVFFVIQERSFGNNPDQRLYLNLAQAQRDERVWGPNAAHEFNPRPVADYHRLSVGFAEPALAPGLADKNARACPAKDLALAMATVFMREFVSSITQSTPFAPDMHKKVWKVTEATPDDGGNYKALQPSDIELTANEPSSIRLYRPSSDLPQKPRTGIEELSKMDPKALEKVREIASQASKFDKVNLHTKLFMKWAESVAENYQVPASAVPPPQHDQVTDPSEIWTGPIPGLRMLTRNDVPTSASRDISLFVQGVGLAVLDSWVSLDLNETVKELVYFDSPAESYVAMDMSFGKLLPPQYSSWRDLASDSATADLCITGIAAWYLSGAKTAKEAGHDVPAGAVMECNLEYLSQYETRSPWLRYGHTAYLGQAQNGETPKLLGIWECHSKKLVKPGESKWEEAKAGFRCSVTTSITLKEHLAASHWTYGNYMMNAARESLNHDHPIRRLLRQFYYNTAAINYNAKEILFPPKAFGYRVFGFTEKSWVQYFTDLFASFSWKPFSETFEDRKLPAEFLKEWPLQQDGVAVFDTFSEYTRKYVDIFYDSDTALNNDAELKEFWAHFDKYLKWKLPALTKPNLARLIADLMWWVTAGHEFHGAIVEYLTVANGLFPKIAPGKAESDVQTFAQSLVLISLTGVRMPALMDDWTHIFQVPAWDARKQQEVLNVVRGFQVSLEKCAGEIEERNVLRERRGQRAFNVCNPRILETSVSI